MRTTNFTADIRIFLCEACGGPLDAPLAGGQFACTYCRATNVVSGRDERPTLGMPAMPMPIDEGERLRRLQMQDGRPLVPPPSLMALIPHGQIEPWRVQEVFAVYQGTRKEVRATHSPDAGERLFFLTLIIANHLGSTKEDARLRAVLETALDTLELPRHRQVLRGMLSRNAVREGDVMAAERWLAPCDARSDDLMSDSAFRVSRALLDTARGDHRAVIAVVGPTEQHVPIDDTMDSSAAVLRANALEKSGDMNGAVQALQTRMAKAGPTGRAAIEAFIRLTPSLRLCEHSFARATAAHTERAAGNAGRGAMIFGGIFLVAGIGMLVLGVGLGLVMGGGGVIAALSAGNASMAMPGMIGGMFGMCAGPGLAGAAFVAVGFVAFQTGRQAAELRRIGLSVYGTVTNVSSTNVRINNVPVYAIAVRVERQDIPPYDATFKVTGLPAGVAVGARVPLRVHPQKTALVQLESD